MLVLVVHVEMVQRAKNVFFLFVTFGQWDENQRVVDLLNGKTVKKRTVFSYFKLDRIRCLSYIEQEQIEIPSIYSHKRILETNDGHTPYVIKKKTKKLKKELFVLEQ
jgi:hypothetical protein